MGTERGLLLSVIIPVYNVEAYLGKSLSSVAEQTLDQGCYEVIVVDDASTDASLEVARRFESRHPNFRVEALPENTAGGSGIPSNIGVRLAKGKYVGFVDADDWVEPDMFEKMLEKALSEDADLVICDFMEYDELGGETFLSYDKVLFDAVADPSFQSRSSLEQKKDLLKLSPVPWRKIYRRSFMLSRGVFFPEGDYFFEDNPLHWFSIIPAGRVAVVPEALVIHRKNRAGQTMGADGRKFLAFIDHGKTIRDYLQSCQCYPEFRLEFLNWLINQCLWIMPKMDPGVTSKFIRGMEPLFREFSRRELAGYFQAYPWKALVMNGMLYVIKGRYFLHSQLNFGPFRLASNLLAVFYFFGFRKGYKVVKRRKLRSLLSTGNK